VKATLELINRMRSEGVISQYSIGGAVGATFYLEPSATVDIDIFVILPTTPGSPLVSLSPIYEFLKKQGCAEQGEYIVIGDWPVQFLPASNALEEEALAEALRTEVEGVPTYVMRAEHLIAIALRTGRPKDHNRVLQFLEQGTYDNVKLKSVLHRHGLESQWEHVTGTSVGGAS
jgi:hypothetical protein